MDASEKNGPKLKTWWQHILLADNVGCGFLALVWVVITLGALYGLFLGPPSERGSHSLFNRAGRAATLALKDFHAKNGYYPPQLDGRPYYGPWDDSLVAPFKVEPSIEDDYKGPIIDPFRQAAIFPKEVRMKVHYTGSRNPESDKLPWKYFRGYAPRYYRSPDGQMAFILSNGPDRDIDIGTMELDAVQSTSATEVVRRLLPLAYDATNGTGYSRSSGDLFNIVSQDW